MAEEQFQFPFQSPQVAGASLPSALAPPLPVSHTHQYPLPLHQSPPTVFPTPQSPLGGWSPMRDAIQQSPARHAGDSDREREPSASPSRSIGSSDQTSESDNEQERILDPASSFRKRKIDFANN